MVAGREHLGQPIRPLALGGLGQVLGGQRRYRGTERRPAGQVLHRHVAQPLALLAARAVLPGVVHALAQRVGAGRPELVEQRIGRGEAAARLDRIVDEVGAQAAEDDAFRRIAHRELHPADRAPFEALEGLHAGLGAVAAEVAVGAEPGLRLRPGVGTGPVRRPFAGQALGAGDLDLLAATRLDLEPRPAGHDLPEVEQDGGVAPGLGADHGMAALELGEIVPAAQRAGRRFGQRLLVGAAMERQVRVGNQAAHPDDPLGGHLVRLQHRDAARDQHRERPRLQPAVHRVRPAAAGDQPLRFVPAAIVEAELGPAGRQRRGVEVLDEAQRVVRLRRILRPGVRLCAAPALVRRERNRAGRRLGRALGPEAAVAEGWLPHALGGLVEGGVAAIGVDQHRDHVVARPSARPSGRSRRSAGRAGCSAPARGPASTPFT